MQGRLERLRAMAVGRTLFGTTRLGEAVERLGFVQADPIRAPARAQDLILRQRVEGYREGDLTRWYPGAEVEETLLYAYGYVPRRTWDLLRPREAATLTPLEQGVWATVRDAGPLHPRELDERFGRERAVNGWGGHSRVTKLALERLHRRGLLRIARRDKGVRCYEAAPPLADDTSPDERLRELVGVVAGVLAPALERTVVSIAARLGRKVGGVADHRAVVRGLVDAGELVRQTVDGLAYVWPAGEPEPAEPAPRVRFLAPFDPLVWDRRRFEHLWGWPYRFEAYTPPAERVRGYYAMPLLFGERVVGWANAERAGGRLDVELGFVEGPPGEPGFGVLVDEEVARLEAFLGR